ncbi:two-component system regulatory protein YycI [Anaerotignum sp.]
MEWGRAKQFVIVLLVILNVVLAGLNYRQRQENTMTSAQERAIFEVLSQNGITMYTDLPTDLVSMPRLEVELPEYSKETLERLFFGSEKTTVTVKGSQNLYRNEYASLTLDGAHGLFKKNTVEIGKGEMTKADAQKEAQKFIDGTEYFFGTYDEPVVTEMKDGFRVDFFGVYKRENVFANYFSILVTQNGIRQIEFEYCPIVDYNGEKRELAFSDEALLTFMREWKKSGTAEQATIHRIELGYDKMERSTAATDGAIYLDPCYRIYLMEEEEPYLVNAYTCQIFYKD